MENLKQNNMTKIKKPQKVLAIDDRDTVRLSPLINTPLFWVFKLFVPLMPELKT